MRKTVRKESLRGFVLETLRELRMHLTTRLTLSFLLVILMTSAIFTVAGILLIGNRILAEAQETVKRDLNSAREIYMGKLRQVNDVVRLTADRYIIITALKSGGPDGTAELLRSSRRKADILTVTTQPHVLLMAK
jgi:two-component system NtrC family sensor kinase